MKQESKESINYFEIVKKAFTLPWKYRFLFWLGVLASFAGGGGSNFSSYSTSSTDLQNLFNKDTDKSSRLLDTLKGAPRVLGVSTDKFSEFISHNIYWIALVILILVLIAIALLVFGTFARAGIIRSIPRIEKGEATYFSQALFDGKRFFWRIVAASLLSFIFFLLAILILGGISVPLFLINIVLGFVWLVPAILILIITVIYVGLIIQFWTQIFIVEDQGVISTIKPAIKLVNSRFKEVIIFWLAALVINFVYIFAVGIVIFVVVLPFGLLAIGAGIANLIAGIIIGVIAFLIIYLAMLAISGYYTAGITSYWILAYLEIKKIKN
ncbi:hypothetical protein KJ713_00465 [Patescibacteria group bacterium]|nr:hypothetical protein [Patescibacteria group bacterium]